MTIYDSITQPWPLLPARQNLANLYQSAYDLWDQSFAEQILNYAKPLALQDQTMRNVYNIYNGLWGFMNNLQEKRGDVYQQLNDENLWRLAYGFQNVDRYFWPQGEATQQQNQYFSNLWNYLARKNAQDRLYNSNLASKYWLSNNYIQALNERQALSEQEKAIKLFEDQNRAVSDINKQYNAYYQNLLQNIKWVGDDYVKWFVDTNAAQQAQLWTGLANSLISFEQLNRQLAQQKAAAKPVAFTKPATPTPNTTAANNVFTDLWMAQWVYASWTGKNQLWANNMINK